LRIRDLIILIIILCLYAVTLSATVIRIKRGPAANLPVKAPYGSMYQTKDTNKVFIGNSTSLLELRQRGYSGAQGLRGYRGYSGLQGLRGFRGYSGLRGYRGYSGLRGISGFSGEKSAPPLFCALSSGTTVVTYDVQGINPKPSPIKDFFVKLWQGATALSVTKTSGTTAGVRRFAWNTGATITGRKSQVYGSSTSAKFAPLVLSTYSASRGNGVLYVQITYSTANIVNNTVSGKRVCVTGIPIVVYKTPSDGAIGPVGPAGIVTRKSIFDNMTTGNSASNSPFQFRPSTVDSTTPALMGFRNYSGHAKIKFDGAGYQSFIDRNGYPVIKAGADGTVALFVNNVKWLDMTASKTVTVYRNAVAVYQIYSTGRWKGAENWPDAAHVAAGHTSLFTNQYGFRQYTSGGSGGGGGGSVTTDGVLDAIMSPIERALIKQPAATSAGSLAQLVVNDCHGVPTYTVSGDGSIIIMHNPRLDDRATGSSKMYPFINQTSVSRSTSVYVKFRSTVFPLRTTNFRLVHAAHPPADSYGGPVATTIWTSTSSARITPTSTLTAKCVHTVAINGVTNTCSSTMGYTWQFKTGN
jgi:hypothetical protein